MGSEVSSARNLAAFLDLAPANEDQAKRDGASSSVARQRAADFPTPTAESPQPQNPVVLQDRTDQSWRTQLLFLLLLQSLAGAKPPQQRRLPGLPEPCPPTDTTTTESWEEARADWCVQSTGCHVTDPDRMRVTAGKAHRSIHRRWVERLKCWLHADMSCRAVCNVPGRADIRLEVAQT